MNIHILGICGTFMGGLAAIAKAAGHQVSGSDENFYPPMSEQLIKLGIPVQKGYGAQFINEKADCVVIGNGLSRGNVAIEELLKTDIPYISGPQWLYENILKDKWVLAIAGTHGKTTTSSMLAWILEHAKCSPGFLIGGVPLNFGVSARLGESDFFVIEADEYDTAFFDKRSKFLHYRPNTLSITNIEYDHADIFADLDAVLWQFHQLLRTIPPNGSIKINGSDPNIKELLLRGVWTSVETFGVDDPATWSANFNQSESGSEFRIYREGKKIGEAVWGLYGKHNIENALAAISAADHVGVAIEDSINALSDFQGVKRRLEKKEVNSSITLYDDFAHHPTAIRASIEALRKRHRESRIVVVIEPRSNTMRMGIHKDLLNKALKEADRIFVLAGEDLQWDPGLELVALGSKLTVCGDVDSMLANLLADLKDGDCVVMMSNGDFRGLRNKLQKVLKNQN